MKELEDEIKSNDTDIATKQAKLDTSQLFLDSGGVKVGIGTDSPAYHLHLKDSGDPSFKIERASNNFLMINETHFMIVKPANTQFDFNSQGHTQDMVFKTNNIERLRLKANGHVVLSNLPDAYPGLGTGTLWVDGNGFLKVA